MYNPVMRYREQMSSAHPTTSVLTHDHNESHPWWRSTRSAAYAALAIALIAVAVAIAAWLRPAHEAPSFSDQQSAQAKKNICSAALVVNKAVFADAPNPHPGDPVGAIAVAANVRLALLGGGAYLRDAVAAEPAAQANLAKAATSMANTLQQTGISYAANTATPAVLSPLQQDLASEMRQINSLCGFGEKH